MRKLDFNYLPSLAYLITDFTKEELTPLLEEVEEIKKNPKNFVSYSNELIGQIKEEYELRNNLYQYLNDLLMPSIKGYIEESKFFKHYCVLHNSTTLSLGRTWVNFQKKHEFNPVHNHTGLLSFVIWLEVPYDIESERQVHPGQNSPLRLEGSFSFHFVDSMGELSTHTITIDKSMIYKCIIFPSKLSHSVNPFYSSDGSRISVSGNFYFDN